MSVCAEIELLLPLLICASPLSPLSPLTSACPVNAAVLKPTPTWSLGWTEAVWLSESIPESAAQPLLKFCDSHSSGSSLPRDKRPPHQKGGMTLLSGLFKIPNLPTWCVSSNPRSWRQGWDSS